MFRGRTWAALGAVTGLVASLLVTGAVAGPAQASDGPEGVAFGWGLTSALGTNGVVTDDSTAIPVAAAVRSSGDDTYVQLSVAEAAACGLTADGDAYCWGSNSYGQLGDGTTTNSDVPVAVVAGANAAGTWTSIDAGAKHVCGVAPDGSAYCWGEGNIGRLGNGGNTDASSPVAVASGENTSGVWRVVSAGGYVSCGIGGDDSAYCWGAGSAGALGNGATSDQYTPVRVLGGPYVSVSAGRQHACAVTTDFAVDCWGLNTYGQLGDGTITGATSPVRVQLPSGSSAWNVQAGDVNSCAVMSDARLMCWGDNTYGQLGGGGFGGFMPSPVDVWWGQWMNVSVGALSICAVRKDTERAMCWGYNGSGQVGDGTLTDVAVPTDVDYSGVLVNLRVNGVSTGLRLSGNPATASMVLGHTTSEWARLDSSNFLDVGEVTPGSSGTGSITFTNSGNLALHVPTPLLRVVEPNADVFAITGDTCSGQIIPAGGTCTVTVTGSPTESGPLHGLMTSNPAATIGNEKVYLAVRGARTAPVYPTRTWWVAQSGTANLASGTSCAAPDAVGSDDTAIRAVLDLVSADDTVHICAGVYDITSTLNVDDSIAVQGDAAAATALTGGDSVQVMRVLDYGINSSAVADPEVLVRDLTITRGAAGTAGGSFGEDCNYSKSCGGAIYVEDGSSLRVVDSVFVENQAAFGGGAIGTNGGGDYNGGRILIESSTFANNTAGLDGGAVGLYFNAGGGRSNRAIVQSTFAGNRALGRSGGAVSFIFANGEITDSTFWENTGFDSADAIYGDVTVAGSLIANSSPRFGSLCNGSVSVNSTNVASDGSCDVAATAYDDMKIIDLGDWGGPTPTVWIGPGSAADDANTGTCPAVDQRGASRATPCDAGAFERRSSAAQATTSDLAYPASAAIGSAALPTSTPAVAAAAPAPIYSTSLAVCTVNLSTGEVTGTAAGQCTVNWTIGATLTQDGAQGDDSLTITRLDQSTLSVVAPSSADINSTVALSTTGGAGGGAVTYDVGASTVCSVSGATLTLGPSTGVCTVTATKAADSTYNATTSAPVTITVTDPSVVPTPPTPVPPAPPAPPADGKAATPLDRAIRVTWQPPAQPGSFAVTQYQVSVRPTAATRVTSANSDRGCLVPATESSCVIEGLRNGVTYDVRIRALNGAGWSAWSDLGEATPQADPDPGPGPDPKPEVTVVVTGSRSGVKVRVKATIDGGGGRSAVLMVKARGATAYEPLDVKPKLARSDRVVWKWRSAKRVFAYAVVGDVRSNRVILRGR